MIHLLMELKFRLERVTESKPKEKRTIFSKIILNGLKCIATYFIYIIFQIKKISHTIKVQPLEDRGDFPIVSLTTFPKRIPNLWMVLYCLFEQTVRPGKIVVTLIKDEVSGGFDTLPASLRMFADKGVEFLFKEINLRPHNKYFYVRKK